MKNKLCFLCFSLLFCMAMFACTPKKHQVDEALRRPLLDSIRFADSIAAQVDIDSLIKLTDSLRNVVDSTKIERY